MTERVKAKISPTLMRTNRKEKLLRAEQRGSRQQTIQEENTVQEYRRAHEDSSAEFRSVI